MRITNYSVPNEEQMREIEGRYFIPQEIIDQIKYAADKGKEIFDNITTPSEVGGDSGSENGGNGQNKNGGTNIGKPLLYTGGAIVLGLAVYFGYKYYTKTRKK
jgi:hypothetical protein